MCDDIDSSMSLPGRYVLPVQHPREENPKVDVPKFECTDGEIESIRHESMDIDRLLLECDNLWAVAAYPRSDPLFVNHLKNRLLEAKFSLELHPVVMKLYKINHFLSVHSNI